MKPIVLAVAVAVLSSACTTSELEQRAAAERAAAGQPGTRSASSVAASTAQAASAATAAPDAASVAAQELPHAAAPTAEHAWLQQLLGEWTFTCKEPFAVSGTESVRAVGELWIVAEGHATMGGQPIESRMTLGYHPEAGAFVGTWLDSTQTLLWSYKGSLDAARKTLTLDTEGPSFDDPKKTSRYRDAIEVTDADHKVLTSSVLGEDGQWTTFMRAEYVRRK